MPKTKSKNRFKVGEKVYIIGTPDEAIWIKKEYQVLEGNIHHPPMCGPYLEKDGFSIEIVVGAHYFQKLSKDIYNKKSEALWEIVKLRRSKLEYAEKAFSEAGKAQRKQALKERGKNV